MASSARKVQQGLVTSTASAATAKMHHKLGPFYIQKGKIFVAEGLAIPSLRTSVL